MASDREQDGATLEAASDELLRTHGGFGRRAGYYTEDSLIRRSRREISLEQIAEQRGYQLLIPADALRRAIGSALAAGCTRPQAMVWVLEEHYSMGQREIADLLGISQQAVSRRLARARARIWDQCDDCCPALIIFARESHRFSYHPPHRRQALPEELQEARRILEAAGWETWILPEDLRQVLLVRDGVIQEGLTARQVIARARRLAARRKNS